jgi:alpha-glucosidase
MIGLVAAATVITAMPVVATAAEQDDNVWTVSAPAGTRGGPEAEVRYDPATGTVSLAVSDDDRTVLEAAPVGITTSDADLSSGLRLLDHSSRTVTERYTMTTGKELRRVARMTETRFSFAGSGGDRMDLLVRAADDGIAYRYVVPESGGAITAEASAFSIPDQAAAWLLPYTPNYEANRIETTAAEAPDGDYGYPSLFDVGGTFALLTESDVDGNYAGSRLRHDTGSGTYQVVLADEQVSAHGAVTTPWRTAIVGELATVTESTLVDDLASPAKFTDTSWIRPGKVAWSWLSEHSSPSDFERQKDYVDFAARHGWPYVLVDEGWSDAWVPELTRYARARGVEVLLWFHWTRLDTAEERDTMLPLVKSWGVKGVKVDFMDSDSQARYRWYDAILADTAEQQLMVNFHGSTIPHGLARTWPHIMTMEGVRGAENFPPPANNPVQPFTRNVVGSMDYTPVSLEVGLKQASVAHEVALPVVYESGWQHFADKPEAYERHPEALRFLDQIPTVWDETQLVAGYPGDEAVFARRSGDRWFLGAIAAGQARDIRAPLDFLGGGRWLVETVRDRPDGNRGDVIRTADVLTSDDVLDVAVPDNGGFAAVMCPYRPGVETCDEPKREVPRTSLTVTPQGTLDIAPGDTFEVAAEFTVLTGERVRNVVFAPTVPEGWSFSGEVVRRTWLEPGEAVQGSWTVTVGSQAQQGFRDVPIAAEFRLAGERRDVEPIHVAGAVETFVPPPVPSGEAYVSDLPFVSQSNGYGPVERDASNGEAAGGDGNPLTIGGVSYDKGIGVHAPSEVTVYLGGRCSAFTAQVGLDDETNSPGSVAFEVVGDDEVLHRTDVLRGEGPAIAVEADVMDVRMLTLRVTDGGDGKNFDHADWAEAAVSCA